MKTTNPVSGHPDRGQLLELLDDAQGHEDANAIRLHVESCAACQEALENLAADPGLWLQVSTLAGDDRQGDTIGALSSSIFRVNDTGRSGFVPRARSASEDDCLFPLQDLLEKPVHPEMLGRLGGYDIEYEIGRGGMGVVFKAFDSDLNRPVAIKVMSPMLAGRGVARERFAREARAAAAVLHPNVIAIYGVATAHRVPYLVMPYIKGPSIEQLVEEQGPLSEREIVAFSMQMAAGLAAAHAQGVVHRDIKPANVLVENGIGRVVITDFGLARAESEVSMTQTGWFAGTPAFMSPEQARGEDCDARSDLFSLGSVMYYMATGRVPFRADQPMAVLERIRNEKPRPVQQLNGQISRTLSDLIEWLLEKNPAERIPSAARLHQLLEQYLAHLHDPSRTVSPAFASTAARARRNHAIRSWGLAASAAIMAIAAIWTVKDLPPEGNGAGFVAGPGEACEIQVRIQTLADKYKLITMDQLRQDIGAALSKADEIRIKFFDHPPPDLVEPQFLELDLGISGVQHSLEQLEDALQN